MSFSRTNATSCVALVLLQELPPLPFVNEDRGNWAGESKCPRIGFQEKGALFFLYLKFAGDELFFLIVRFFSAMTTGTCVPERAHVQSPEKRVAFIAKRPP